MNYLQRVALRIAGLSQKGVVKAPFTGGGLSRFGGNSYGALVNRDYLKEYRNWVFACVTARSEALGDIKLRLMKKGEELFEHELLDVINKVNPSMTKHQLFEATQSFKDLEGNAYWYLARDGKDGNGKIREIYLLKPDKVRIVINKENPLLIEGYLFSQAGGDFIPFKPEDILHFKNFNPNAYHPFPHKGMSIVEAAAFAVDSDNEARAWNLNFFKNGARPDGILITDGESAMDPTEFKRLNEEWNEEHQGSANAHKISILSGGMKYQELTRNQKDMDFLGQRTFSRDEILALFRVPKSIIGITDDVNRANAEASVYVFNLRTVKPLMQKMVDTLNEFLVPYFEDGLYFEFESPVQEDRVALTAEYTAAWGKWLSTNDIRRKEGLAPTEFGEELYLPIGTEVNDQTPVPEDKKTVKKPDVSKKSKKTGKDTDVPIKTKTTAEEIVEKYLGKLPQTKSQQNEKRKGLSADEKTAHIDDWNKRMSSVMPLKRKVRDFFAQQEKEVQKNLKEEMKGLPAKEFKHKALSDVVFNYEKAISASIDLITPFIEQYLRESGNAGNRVAHGTGFDFNDPAVQEFIPKRAKYFAESINGTTREDLLASIQEGIDAGEDLDQISQRVADIYGKAQDYRTDAIARTEVSAASNYGAVEAYKQAGVEDHQWVVVDPEDDDCLMNDGEIVKIGDAFPSGDTESPIHTNCQCTTIPIFGDEGDDGE